MRGTRHDGGPGVCVSKRRAALSMPRDVAFQAIGPLACPTRTFLQCVLLYMLVWTTSFTPATPLPTPSTAAAAARAAASAAADAAELAALNTQLRAELERLAGERVSFWEEGMEEREGGLSRNPLPHTLFLHRLAACAPPLGAPTVAAVRLPPRPWPIWNEPTRPWPRKWAC